MGRTNERIGRIQESYVANATTSWLESLERSLAQMKEYQVGRQWIHTLGMLIVWIGRPEEAGEPQACLRRFLSQNAESEERRFQG